METLAQAKRVLRKEMSLRRDAVSEAEHTSMSAALTERLYSHAEFERAKIVMSFVSIRSEVNTEKLNSAIGLEKRLVLPRVVQDSLECKLYKGEELRISSMGVPEPVPECESVSVSEIDLILVPGLAFDEQGFRLGYGGGFYDRLLAGFSGCAIGLCYDFQVLKSVPTAKWDVALSLILTNTRTIVNVR